MKFALFTTIDFDRAAGEADEVILARCSALVQAIAQDVDLARDLERCWMIRRDPPDDGVRLHILGTYWNGAGADNARRRLSRFLSEEKRQGGQAPQFSLERNIAIYEQDEAFEGIDPVKGSPHI